MKKTRITLALILFVMCSVQADLKASDNKYKIIAKSHLIKLIDFNGKRLISINGGRSWNDDVILNNYSIRLNKKNHYYKSNDMGRSWIKEDISENFLIYLFDNNKKYYSSDLGKNWTEIVNSNNEIDLLVNVYPNPSQDKIFLLSKSYIPIDASFRLYDSFGNLVQISLQKESDYVCSFDISSLLSGTYFLRINFTERNITKKFLVIH